MAPTSDSAAREALEIITAENQIKSPLLRLPAEIRNQIYGYVLGHGVILICSDPTCPIGTDWTSFWWAKSQVFFSRHILHLLEVCQQVHSEARLVAFNMNQLTGNLGRVHDFLMDELLDFDQVSALKSLNVQIGNYQICFDRECVDVNLAETSVRELERLAKLAGLKDIRISIRCRIPSHRTSADFCKMARSEVEAIFYRKDRTVKVEILVHRT